MFGVPYQEDSMQNIKNILAAANQTSEYIELMRMPTTSEGVVKYTELKFEKGEPVLKNTGFTMMSPTVSKVDMVSTVSGLAAGPYMVAKGSDEIKNNGMVLGSIMVSLGGLLTLGSVYKTYKYSKSTSLIFPKVPGK